MSGAMTGLRRARKAFVGAAMLVSTAASLLIVAPAADAATSCTLKAEGIEARDLEDNSWYWWDDTDEISINYNSNRYLYTTIKQNQTAYPPNFTFSGSMSVELREWDEDLNGSAKHLGTISISESENNLGSRSKYFGVSNTNGYEYRFSYRVECSTPVTNVVPDVTGRTVTEATNVLKSAGYLVARSNWADCGPSGYVLDQSPRGGSALASGNTVRIYVSTFSSYCYY